MTERTQSIKSELESTNEFISIVSAGVMADPRGLSLRCAALIQHTKMKPPVVRNFLSEAALLVPAPFVAGRAWAEMDPGKPIKIVVPFAVARAQAAGVKPE